MYVDKCMDGQYALASPYTPTRPKVGSIRIMWSPRDSFQLLFVEVLLRSFTLLAAGQAAVKTNRLHAKRENLAEVEHDTK